MSAPGPGPGPAAAAPGPAPSSPSSTSSSSTSSAAAVISTSSIPIGFGIAHTSTLLADSIHHRMEGESGEIGRVERMVGEEEMAMRDETGVSSASASTSTPTSVPTSAPLSKLRSTSSFASFPSSASSPSPSPSFASAPCFPTAAVAEQTLAIGASASEAGEICASLFATVSSVCNDVTTEQLLALASRICMHPVTLIMSMREMHSDWRCHKLKTHLVAPRGRADATTAPGSVRLLATLFHHRRPAFSLAAPSHLRTLTCVAQHKCSDFLNYLYIPARLQPKVVRIVLVSCDLGELYSPDEVAKLRVGLQARAAYDVPWVEEMTEAMTGRMDAMLVANVARLIVVNLSAVIADRFQLEVYLQREAVLLSVGRPDQSATIAAGAIDRHAAELFASIDFHPRACHQCSEREAGLRCPRCRELIYCSKTCMAEGAEAHWRNCDTVEEKRRKQTVRNRQAGNH